MVEATHPHVCFPGSMTKVRQTGQTGGENERGEKLFSPYIILPEVSKQGEGGELSMGAEEEAVGLLQRALLQQQSILGKQVQRHRVHQENRQAILVHQPKELLY